MLTSRRARIATLVATGVLGFGGMAAASPSFGQDAPVVEKSVVVQQDESTDTDEDESVAPEPVAEPVVEPVEVPVVEVPAEQLPAEDDQDTDFDETTCRLDNHGKTVSAVAHGDFPGVSVTDAAHSSCGKTGEVEEPEVDDSEVEEPEIEEPEVESEDSEAKADRPDKSDKGAEKAANGNGNGNGNGNRDD